MYMPPGKGDPPSSAHSTDGSYEGHRGVVAKTSHNLHAEQSLYSFGGGVSKWSRAGGGGKPLGLQVLLDYSLPKLGWQILPRCCELVSCNIWRNH